jgi:hypothetical protein
VPNSIPSVARAAQDSDDPYDAFAGEEDLPFGGPLVLRALGDAAEEEPSPGSGAEQCDACRAPDDDYVWVADRWRVRSTRRPTGLPVVVGLELRPHLDLGDLPNLLAAELGVMTVRLEKAIRSLPGVADVHVSRWGDSEGHLRVWFLARPPGRMEFRGPHLPLWDRALPRVADAAWRDRLGAVAVWLAGFGGRAVVDPPRLDWQPLPQLSGDLTDVEPE